MIKAKMLQLYRATVWCRFPLVRHPQWAQPLWW